MSTEDSTPPQSGLSPELRAVGQARFRRYQILNGVSVAFIMENMLILYAIRNGMSDALVAVLASFVHLTMPFMFLGKRFIVRRGLAKTWGLGWFLRYLSIGWIVFAPMFADSSTPWLTPAIILVSTFGFTLFRAMGLTAGTPLVGEITTDQDRGRYISGNVVRGRIAYFCAMIGAILLLRFSDAIWAYQLIIVLGCLIGLAASRILSTIPESDSARASAAKPVVESFRELFGVSSRRRLVIGWCCGFTTFALVIPYAVIAIKNGYGLSDDVALVYSVLTIVGGIFASLMNSILGDHVGPRPLLVLYGCGLWACSLFFALAPEILHPFLVGFVFFVAGFCKIGILINLGHYMLSLVDDSERVGANLFVRMLSGAAAGIAGSVLGASLLEGLQRSSLTGMGVYRTYFMVITALLVPVVFGLYKMERLREWRVRDILGLLVSPRDLRALFVMSRLNSAATFAEDERHVGSLATIGSSVSEELVRNYLSSPQLAVRQKALRALRHTALSEETVAALLDELRSGEYTTASTAAEILGEHRIESAVPALRESLKSADPYLRGTAMMALARLKDVQSYDEIRRLFREAENPRVVIRGAQALVEIRKADDVELLLAKTMEPLPEPVIDEVLAATAELTGCAAKFYHLSAEYARGHSHGVQYLATVLDGTVIYSGDSSPRFGRLLTDLAGASHAEHADGVGRFLAGHPADRIPQKVGLCVALSLADGISAGTVISGLSDLSDLSEA